jgi:hypothetical protein
MLQMDGTIYTGTAFGFNTAGLEMIPGLIVTEKTGHVFAAGRRWQRLRGYFEAMVSNTCFLICVRVLPMVQLRP